MTGRRTVAPLKCLTIEDEFTRQGLAIHAARSITAGDVIRVLQVLFLEYGVPVRIPVKMNTDSGGM